MDVRLNAQRNSQSLEAGLHLAGGIQHVAARMARARVIQGLRPGIEPGQDDGDKSLEVHVLSQHSIGSCQNITRITRVQRQRPQISAGFRHQQRRTHPVTGHVRHDNPQAPIGHRQIIEIIAPGGFGWIRGAGDVKHAGLGRGLWEESLLDFARHAELLLVNPQFRLSPFSFSPLARLGQLALHRGNQPSQVAFHDVVPRAVLHRGHRDFLADGAGHDDEGQVESFLIQQLQRGQGIELRHGEIGHDQVPGLLVESGAHGGGSIDPFKRRLISSAPQLMQQQLRVLFGVLDDQDAEGLAHASARLDAGRSLIMNETSPSAQTMPP